MAAKRLQDDLNLTPFVDLFSTLVVFLLLTAVWIHLEALTTNTDKVTSSDSAPSTPQDKKVNLTLTIMPDRVELAEDTTSTKIPHVGPDLNVNQIVRVLEKWKQKYPDRNDIVLNTENTIPYRHLITAFDTMVGAGFPDVGVNTQ